jgi:hypothetical protein
MIDRLVHGLAVGADLTAEEILDVLWLAASHAAGQAPSDLDEPADTPVPEEPGQQPLEGDFAEPASAAGPDLALHLDAEPAEGESQTPATEVGFGAPRPIRDALTLPMALRRLRQVRAPGPRLTVDIDATVDATAEARRLLLVLGRPWERALDLALVVDDAPSMRIWDDTFDDLERLLGQTGAFRAVSRWRLDPRSGAIRPEAHGSPQPPQRLIDPSGRRLVLVATDARDRAWYSARPWDAVAAWCAAMPTVLIQVLPPHYWPATAIGDPYITTRARRPAAPNGQYDHRIAWWATDPGGPPLPVVTLAPAAVDAWAQAVVNGTAWTSGITATPPDPEHAPDLDGEAEPVALVNDFLSRASPGAQRLARILASAGALSMPLITVLRERLAPETGVLELAEILASGLLTETWPTHGTGQPLLRYRPGTRELLRRGTTAFEEWDAYGAVSQYLDDRQRLGGPLRALVPDAGGAALLDASDEPFAALHQALAARLGLGAPAGNERTAAGQEDPRTDETGESLADEAGEPLIVEPAQAPPEPDNLDLGPMGEDGLPGLLARKIYELGDTDQFMIIEFGQRGPVLWRVARDEVGTPVSEWRLMTPPAPDDSWGAYATRLTAPFDHDVLLVRSWGDESLVSAFTSISQAPGMAAFESATPVEELLRGAVLDSSLTNGYDLVVLSEGPEATIVPAPHPLFPTGAARGHQATLLIRCRPGLDGSVVFATVVFHRGPFVSMKLVSVQSAVLGPGDYQVTATLVQPGVVAFEGLPAELAADERPWEEIAGAIPRRLDPPEAVHLVCLLETSGGEELLRRRVALLEGIIGRLIGHGQPLAISLVTYGPHAVYKDETELPPTVTAWGTSTTRALGDLAKIRALRQPDPNEYPMAAQLECALREVRNRLAHSDHVEGRPVLVTVGGRPPHPARVVEATQIVPCPRGTDWQQTVSDLRRIQDITSFAVPDDSFTDWDTWRAIGWNGIAGPQTDTDLLVTMLGIRQVPASPFPVIVPTAELDLLPDRDDARRTEVAAESAVPDDEEAARAESILADRRGIEAERLAEWERQQPAAADRDVAAISILGPPGSGKTTFLAAFQIALLRQSNLGWALRGADEASTQALVGMTNTLIADRHFPVATAQADSVNWVLERLAERTVRRGLLRRAEKITETVLIRIRLTDAQGALTLLGRIAPDQALLIDQVTHGQGILYMFDPTRELVVGDAFAAAVELVNQLRAANRSARLPHYVAICVTKFDDPQVLGAAEATGLLVNDQHDPQAFPRVRDSDARALFDHLCRSSSRAGIADPISSLFEKNFRPDRIRYFVTSAVGFYVNPDTGFDPSDYQNVVKPPGQNPVIRGGVYPINVAEPVLWLAGQIVNSAGPTSTPPLALPG